MVSRDPPPPAVVILSRAALAAADRTRRGVPAAAVGTMLNCVRRIKERSQVAGGVTLPDPAPMVPTALKTLNNRLFR